MEGIRDFETEMQGDEKSLQVESSGVGGLLSRRDFLKLTSSAAVLLPLLDIPLSWAESDAPDRVVRVRQSRSNDANAKSAQSLDRFKFPSAADAMRACAGRRVSIEAYLA